MFRHASASLLRDVYCLKRSEDLIEKIISPVIFDTNRSFKRSNALSLKNLFQPQSIARLDFSAAIFGITEIRNLG